MGSSKILCCTANLWAKLIGVFEFIRVIPVYVIPLIRQYHYLYHGSDSVLQDLQDEPRIVWDVYVEWYVFLVYAVLVAFMGILLLTGAFQRIPNLLSAWLVWAVIEIIVEAIREVLAIAVFHQIDPISGATTLLTIIVLVFGIFVVSLHKRELVGIGQDREGINSTFQNEDSGFVQINVD